MSFDISEIKVNDFHSARFLSITPMELDMPFNRQRGAVEDFSRVDREEGFSFRKYLSVSLVTAAIASAIFSVCFLASVALFTVSAWYLSSAVIVVFNRVADGSCLEKLVHRLHAMAMEVNSGIAAAALFPLALFKSYHGPQGDPNGRPILMVNGYLSFGSTWHYQAQRLVKAGFGPLYTMNVGSGQSIRVYAEQIQEKVRHIQEETGRSDLILIGHSKGGLVSSYYATHLADPTKTKITDIITIGSPLAGTPMAYLGLGTDAYEMRPSSKFHEQLREKISKSPEMRFSYIASELDELVPLSSALLGKDSSRELVLKDVGHLGLIFSSRVADQVCNWLKDARSS